MSVCSGLDQIEDFLLSSSASMSMPSGSFMVSNTSATNTNRIMGPPITSGHLSGLNLSLNHGLDLTCPTYGCLNLTQSSQQQQQPRQVADVSMTGLNLTQQQMHQSSHNHFGRGDKKSGTSEVGLNLSLQNGMNLTRQAYYYNSDFDYSVASEFSANDNRGNEGLPTMQALDAHRNSPLNLEHRSSPLNLTHSNKFDQNQYFSGFSSNTASSNGYHNYNSNELIAYPGQSNAYYYECHQQPTNDVHYNSYPQQQQQPQTQHQQQQQNAKIRLFCSTCSQEFASSNELNKHIEKHNSQLESSNATINTMCTSTPSTTSTFSNNKSNVNAIKSSWGNADGFQQQSVASTSYEEPLVMNFSSPNEKHEKVEPLAIQPEMSAIVAPPNNSTNKKSSAEPSGSCSECSLTFPTGLDLKKHIDLAHRGRQGGKKYQCLQCAAEFEDIKSHKEHVEGHTQDKPFKCSKCGLHLTNASGLKRHMRRVHDKVGPMHECPECQRTFFERFDLSRHMKVHNVPKCEKCGKGISNKEKKHVCKPLEINDPELKCTICGVQLNNKVKWGFHMWKHTKDPAYIQTRPVAIVHDKTKSHSNEMGPALKVQS